MGIVALLVMGAMFCCVFASDDSAADAAVSVEASSSFCGVNASTTAKDANSVTYTLSGDLSYYYEAKLLDSSGKSSGSVDTPSGKLSDDAIPTKKLNVVAPVVVGDYAFNVKFYDNDTDKNLVAEKNVPLKVVDPIVLSFTLKNSGSSDVSFTAYFLVNGVRVDNNSQTVKIEAGKTADVTYKYYTSSVSDATYTLQTDDKIVTPVVEGLGAEKHFYAQDSDYSVLTGVVVFTLVALAVVAFIIYRKPVINKGKPKGRR